MNNNSSIDILKKEFKRIKSLGYVKNVKSDTNDGGAGNTFEYHLGVVENNLTTPDFEGFEVKTKKTFTHSAISLFTKKPSSKSCCWSRRTNRSLYFKNNDAV